MVGKWTEEIKGGGEIIVEGPGVENTTAAGYGTLYSVLRITMMIR